MKRWTSISEALDFAIHEEEAATDFYTQLAAKVKVPGMKAALEGFAQEEKNHKDKLLAVKAGAGFRPDRPIVDLRIAEYVVDVTPDPQMSYRDALVLAMKKEKAAFKLYTDLAEKATDQVVKATFMSLAQEEARHKARFEVEFDDLLTEN